MTYWKAFTFAAIGAVSVLSTAVALAQISIGIGVAPVCPYGYYDYAPYSCSPYGYYGTDWFNGGVFIGAGPWFHGSRGFYGHVDNRYDPRHGYAGPMPGRGDHAFSHFRQTKHGTDKAMWELQATTADVNIARGRKAETAEEVEIVEAVAPARAILRSGGIYPDIGQLAVDVLAAIGCFRTFRYVMHV